MPTLSVTAIGLIAAVVMMVKEKSPPRRTVLYGLGGAWLGFLVGAIPGAVLDALTLEGIFVSSLGHISATIGATLTASAAKNIDIRRYVPGLQQEGQYFSPPRLSSDYGSGVGQMAVMVMTGGTSGFGAIAAERLARREGLRLIVGARRTTSHGEAVPLDLTALDSVRTFATVVRERLGDTAVDVLILNAGMIRPDVTGRSAEGFESTFAVNHLAQYLLLRLLLPTLADGATVVLTTSGTHDPATGAGLTPPRHADAGLLAYPERDPDKDSRSRKAGQYAYTASKLCTVLTARALSTQRRKLTAIAYDPGQVFGTGLVKELPLPLRTAWSVLGNPVLGWPLRRLNPTLSSQDVAGRTLASLALGDIKPPSGYGYGSLRRSRLTWTAPSELARSDELARALWSDSARLCGLPE